MQGLYIWQGFALPSAKAAPEAQSPAIWDQIHFSSEIEQKCWLSAAQCYWLIWPDTSLVRSQRLQEGPSSGEVREPDLLLRRRQKKQKEVRALIWRNPQWLPMDTLRLRLPPRPPAAGSEGKRKVEHRPWCTTRWTSQEWRWSRCEPEATSGGGSCVRKSPRNFPTGAPPWASAASLLLTPSIPCAVKLPKSSWCTRNRLPPVRLPPSLSLSLSLGVFQRLPLHAWCELHRIPSSYYDPVSVTFSLCS